MESQSRPQYQGVFRTLHVINNPEEAQQKATAAQQFIQTNYNTQTILARQMQRFTELTKKA
ncbi:hypothetical protein AD945_03360 [Gluconobacter albidus]|uniref:Uncharacterized protein n=1 Tax=Gluconobacter albidus TaxID=318683 RepID=A0A149TLQ3_9PROT|nr:hypothetical protein AD945_03360 [Gluconobacter albidus]